MGDSLLTHASLLIELRDPNDARAWSRFVEVYRPLVHGYCVNRGLQEADATDVTQDVMQAVVGAIGRFEYDPRKGAFRNWLLTITRSKLNAFFGHRHRREQGSGRTTVHDMLAQRPDPDDGGETRRWDEAYARRLFDWAAAEARSKVTPSTWRAFYMTAVENKPPQEVAASTGLSVGAVYIAKSRMIAKLRQLVATVSDEQDTLAFT
jgi:RNA polymerase sigma factor (sigma-70 family)